MTPRPSPALDAPPAPSGLLAALRRLWGSWATRSLAVGAVATVLDIGLGTGLLALGAGTRSAAMAGTALGALFGYFANRFFAFKDHDAGAHASALRFVLVAALSTVVHGQLVVWLRDVFGVPFVIAKMASDMVVFNVGQLLLLRYLVFPRRADVVEVLAQAAPAAVVELTPPPEPVEAE
jgi:putative flippase GtrA